MAAADEAPRTARAAGRRRPPAGLVALWALALVVAASWALLVPALQNSDETEHMAYVQTLGENGRLPGGAGSGYSTELQTAASATDQASVVFNGQAKPPWGRQAADAFGRRDLDRTDGGGPSAASSYPPLYYAYASVAYRAASGGDFFTRLSVVRLASGLLLLVTVTGAWLLAGELFGRRRLVQLVAGGTVALWPTLTMVSASVNPDALMVPLWTLAMWLGVKVARRGLTPGRGLALGLLVGAAAVTKISSLVLLPVLLVLVVGRWLVDRRAAGKPLLGAGLALGAAAVPTAAWLIATRLSDRAGYGQAGAVTGSAGGGFDVREFLSYVWQFYLPRLGFMTPVHHQYDTISTKPVINLWVGSGSGTFGWVNVWFDRWVYWIVGIAFTLMVLLAVAGAVRWLRGPARALSRRARLGRLAPAGLLALIAVATLGALHYTDYNFYATGQGLFMQGRYLLPLAGVLAALVGWAVAAAPRRLGGVVAGVWLGGLVAFQLASLALILGRWYVA